MDSMRRNPLVCNLARSTTRRQGVIAGLGAVATGVLAAATTAAAPQSSRNATLPVADARLQRDKFAADGHRPRYHFLPPANWMNDPNGVYRVGWSNSTSSINTTRMGPSGKHPLGARG